jgi:hypothetical protein
MQLSGPTNPFHVSRAYGTVTPPRVVPAQAGAALAKIEPAAEQAAPQRPRAIDQLVGAVVPGSIDFNGSVPAPRGAALPFYSRPGDRNEAATAWQAGRTLDVQG